MKMHDMAIWYLGALDKLGLEGADLMGFSLGGWLAAELATMCPQQFGKLILVGAGGIRPPGGQIYDIFEVTPPMYIRDSLLDPDGTSEYRTVCPAEPEEDILERWENAMEGTCRVSWRPYMHDPGLVCTRCTGWSGCRRCSSGGPRTPSSRSAPARNTSRRIPGSRLEIIDQLRPPPGTGSNRPLRGTGGGLPGVGDGIL